MILTPAPGVLSAVNLNAPVSQAFTVSGGTPPYVFDMLGVGVPEGLNCASAADSLTLQGTMTQQGSPVASFPYNVLVHFVVSDANGDVVRGIYYLPVRPA